MCQTISNVREVSTTSIVITFKMMVYIHDLTLKYKFEKYVSQFNGGCYNLINVAVNLIYCTKFFCSNYYILNKMYKYIIFFIILYILKKYNLL